ncbi:EpsG family protein [Bacteroides fragilis]
MILLLFFLLCYFFPKIRWSDKTVFIIVCLSFIFPFTGISVSDLLMSLLFIPAVVTKLDVYSESSFYAGTMGINIGIIFRFIILVLFIYYHRSLSIKADLYYLLRNGFALAIVLSLVFNNFAILAHRLPYAFREFQIFIVPYFLTIAVGKGNRIIILTFTFIYTLLLLYRALIGENASYYIYDNLLFHLFDK